MAMRRLLEPDCGGANPLMQLAGHVTKDLSRQDEGIRPNVESDQLVNEFLSQIAPPQSFRMDSLLQEMREIDAHSFRSEMVNPGPLVIDEVSKGAWANEFVSEMSQDQSSSSIAAFNELWEPPLTMGNAKFQEGKEQQPVWVKDFFDVNQQHPIPEEIAGGINYNEFVDFMAKLDEASMTAPRVGQSVINDSDNWIEDFEKNKTEEAGKASDYNTEFWNKLQDEWKKLSEGNEAEHPWLTEFSDYYDPYKEYNFSEDNPMINEENALERGKAFLAQGDIPSAVICFEAAAKQHPEDASVWELLGTSQAENEMDPYAIAALKKSNELNPGNMKVLMALAVSYTNESLQSQALKMLTTWLHCNSKYKHLVPIHLLQMDEGAMTSSLIRGPELTEIQNIFLQAVKQNSDQIDPEIQEALGVLFNLSSEYDKAVDCFRAAVQVRPDNAKTWNRLGASLANGNRSVEAVEAYQRALEIEPGFIRARYNVGIICMNLKAYKEAAGHLLTALNLQATSNERSGIASAKSADSNKNMSDTIWSTLRLIVSLMGRRDLQDILDSRDLKALNQQFQDS